MLNVLIPVSMAFGITLLVIPAIMRVADQKKLFDLPDARKLHTRPIASLGGVAIFIGFTIANLLSLNFSTSPEFQYFFAAALTIFFLGLKDDILIISATKKFMGQLLATAIIIHLSGIRIESMYGFLGINELPGPVAVLITYITMIVIINAYNLIDGVDGLAGGLGILSTAAFGTYFIIAGLPTYAIISFSMTAALVAFMVFNFHPAKIFMGDSGSLLLGLTNAVLVVKFINIAAAKDAVYPIASAVSLGFAILSIPLLDTLRVFTIRIYHGRSPFSPDRNHIHHLLLDRGLNHTWVMLSCVGLNAAFITTAFIGKEVGCTWMLSSIVTIAYTMIGALVVFKKPVPKLVVASSFAHGKEIEMHPTTKVVSINKEATAVEQ
jgi:UDP-N-acetylmuramyl pentapeptide phosphotransferase/UDP-N-acetylglucosamine-1-phosphate transferase